MATVGIVVVMCCVDSEWWSCLMLMLGLSETLDQLAVATVGIVVVMC